MTQEQQDPISTAARLLREAAHELQLSHTIGGLGDWSDCEPEVIAAHGEYIAAAAGIERLAESLGVEPLRARQCLHQIQEPGGWTSLPGVMPKPGTPVLLDIGKKFPIRAMWAAKHTVESHDEADPEWCDYDEATDTHYCPEGWYEWNEHEEVHWAVSATPRAWCSLPPSPSSAEGGSNG